MAAPNPLSKHLFIVRHGDAGERSDFVGNDALRPLSPKGIRQAEAIALKLATSEPVRIVSSPALRCIATVVPLAQLCGTRVKELPVLAEGSDPKEAFACLLELVDGSSASVVACSHGDVIGGIVELLFDAGVATLGRPNIKKGAILDLVVISGSVTTLEFLPPPKRAKGRDGAR